MLNKAIKNFLFFVFFFVTTMIFYRGHFNWFLIKLYAARVGLGMAFVWLCARLCEERKITLVKDNLNVFVGLFFLVCCVFAVFSPFKNEALPAIYALATYFLIYLLIANIAADKNSFNAILKLILAVASITVFYGLHQCGWKLFGGTPYSTLGNRNFFGNYLTLALFITLGLFISSIADNIVSKKKQYGSLWPVLYGGIIVLLLVGLFIAQSRGAWLAVVVSIAIFGLFVMPPAARIIYVIFGITAAVMLLYTPMVQNEILEEMQLGVRQHIWRGSLIMFMANFWRGGTGPGTFFISYPKFRLQEYFSLDASVTTTRHSHNQIIELGAEMGIWGSLAFTCIIIVLIVQGAKLISRYRGDWKKVIYRTFDKEKVVKGTELSGLHVSFALVGLWMGLLGVIVHNMVSVDLQFPSMALPFWSSLGLFVAGMHLLKPKKRVFTLKGNFARIARDYGIGVIAASFVISMWLLYHLSYRPFKGQGYFHDGVRLRNAGNWKGSTEAYIHALEFIPNNTRVLYRLAFNYANMEQPQKSLDTYLRLTKLAPNYSRVQSNLGKLYMQLGNLEPAVKNLREALHMNPYSVDDHMSLGQSYFYAGMQKEAIEEVKIAQKLAPDNESIKQLLDNITQGDAGAIAAGPSVVEEKP